MKYDRDAERAPSIRLEEGVGARRKGRLSRLFALLYNQPMTVLSLSLFNGWVLAMSWSGIFKAPSVQVIPGLASEGIWLVSLFACTLTLAVFLAIPKLARSLGCVRLYVAAACMSISTVLSALSSNVPEYAVPLFVASGIISGLGTGMTTAFWGTAITRYDLSIVLGFVTMSLCASAVLTIVIASAPAIVSYALMTIIPIPMAWSFWESVGGGRSRSLGKDAKGASAESDDVAALPFVDDDVSPIGSAAEHAGAGAISNEQPSQARSVLTVVLFFGLVVILGISAGLLRGLTSSGTSPDQNAWMFGIAALCASGMLVASNVPESGESFALFYRAIALIAVAFIALTVVVNQATHQALLALGVHSVGFVYFYGLLWVFCTLYAQQNKRSARVFIGGFFANQAGQIAGALAGDGLGLFWEPHSIIVSASNAMIYLLLFAVIALLAYMSNAPKAQKLVLPSSRVMEQACVAASKEYGLTKRESEILPYLVKGFDRGYIAECFVVSAETVKSHTRHIYDKFGVHSRMELYNAVAAYVEADERA